ncbi:MAG: hypothetical protein CMM77_11455 [Rhodospirillaceae bacterium]|nr:hypothetical protein [Rhodospirillaceae bacterium]
MLERSIPDIKRIPYFCAGCPHNTSTNVPEGMEAAAGIGCHYMAIWMPGRRTSTFTHMGAEGANWIGQAPFTEREHIFVNIGDGTYFHSGILAIRAAVAAKVNVTYKILYNDAVAMTGGQTMDGPLDPARISRQVRAEGVERVAVVTDEPDKYPSDTEFAPGTTIHHRDDLDQVQRDLATWTGVSALIYDQTCAAEKRRRRKRGTFPDPAKRVFINEAVCEGCGDCGVVSNCVAIAPKETDLGRKRVIDQNMCNKDFSCLKGFCPSFVTVHDGILAKGSQPAAAGVTSTPFPVLPDPALPATGTAYNICVTGIGGTGVVTISALLGMAAHIDQKAVTVLDVAGLAQKNGAVYAHVRIADDADALNAVRIAAGGADLLLGNDMVTSGGIETLAKMDADRARAVVNARRTMTAEFTNLPDLDFPDDKLRAAIDEATGKRADFIDFTHLARRLMGDTIAANIMLLGYAFQKGTVPISADAIERAIELNGVAIDFNKQAFTWGRRAAFDPAAIEKLAGTPDAPEDTAFDLDAFIQRRVADLTAYQNAAYAARYTALVEKVRKAETALGTGAPKEGGDLTEAVARSFFKLMAYKDEYEVARLYSAPEFRRALRQTFRSHKKLTVHLAPPLGSAKDARTGHLQKREFGPWMFTAFRLLAPLKGLRGTAFDPFGRTAERKMERALIAEYEATIDTLLAGLTADNLPLATEIAALPQSMRGFGHIKMANVEKAKAREADLLVGFKDSKKAAVAAE